MQITISIWYLIAIAIGSPMLALIVIAAVVAHNKISKQQLMDKLTPYLPKDIAAALDAAKITTLARPVTVDQHIASNIASVTAQRPVFQIPPG
jgi:hypothetical protein